MLMSHLMGGTNQFSLNTHGRLQILYKEVNQSKHWSSNILSEGKIA